VNLGTVAFIVKLMWMIAIKIHVLMVIHVLISSMASTAVVLLDTVVQYVKRI
jgi:hypothetical protein